MSKTRNLRILILTILFLFALFFMPFWGSLSVAAMFALVIHPYICKKPGKIISNRIVITVVTLTTLVILTPLFLGIYSLSSQVIEFSKGNEAKMMQPGNIEGLITGQISKISSAIGLPNTSMSKQAIKKVAGTVADGAVKVSEGIIAGVPQWTIEMIVFALGLYIFLSYGSAIKSQIVRWQFLSKPDLDELIDVLHRGSFQCLSTLLIVGTIQSSLVLLGAAIAGYSMLLSIFIVTFVLSFIPVIGAAPVAFALGFLQIIDGQWGMGIFLFILASFTGLIDNILKPLLVKRGIDMDGAVALIVIIGAIVVLGLPGLFIGPLVGTTASYYFHKIEKSNKLL